MPEAKSRKTRSRKRPDALGSDWTERESGGVRVLEATALAKIPWLAHGFSTRPGGVSDLDGTKALNLSYTNWRIARASSPRCPAPAQPTRRTAPPAK